MRVYVCVCECVYMCVCTRVCVWVRLCVKTVRARECVYACIYINAYTHSHAHTLFIYTTARAAVHVHGRAYSDNERTADSSGSVDCQLQY